ncbi:MAG: hypothetical protein E7480_00380 [Ruminococcaceae bacterium]|nr:hypothetical protein [Oscillospiraceae bacterium]
MDIIFWINLAITIYQFAVLKVHQDLLGGIFGVNASANGYMLVFFCIVIGRSLLKTFDGNESYVYCALKCAASLVIAAMAEMKFYYFAFVLILVVAACLTRFTKEKIVFLILAFVIVVAAASLLTFWYSEFDNFFSLETLFELATKENYSSENDINRLSAISVMMDKYIVEPGQQIFGKGLGNCDGSDVSIFNSPFYQNYSFLHYSWFAFVMIFLETGFVGLGLFLAFFVLCAVYSRKQLKNNTGNRLFCQLGILMAILSIVIAFYNASLRIEAGYMVYFALALPFMINTEDENSQNISTD